VEPHGDDTYQQTLTCRSRPRCLDVTRTSLLNRRFKLQQRSLIAKMSDHFADVRCTEGLTALHELDVLHCDFGADVQRAWCSDYIHHRTGATREVVLYRGTTQRAAYALAAKEIERCRSGQDQDWLPADNGDIATHLKPAVTSGRLRTSVERSARPLYQLAMADTSKPALSACA
jgi:hypothetical protein